MHKNSIKLVVGALLTILCGSLRAAVILQYHHVSDTTPASTSISPQLFEQHLDYIVENGYSVWPLTKLVHHIQKAKTLPDKVVSITFDDAYVSVFTQAYPKLLKRNMPFTIFVNTQPIEQGLSSFMSWKQLSEVQTHGATIANHTHTHLHLVRRKEHESTETWLDRLNKDITLASQVIEQNLGANTSASALLAYPYGEYTGAVQTLIRDLGYVGFGQQSGAVGNKHDLSALPRFPMTNRFGAMKQFKLKISSLPMPMEQINPEAKIVGNATFDDGLSILFKDSYPTISCFFDGKALSTNQTNEQTQTRVQIDQLPSLPTGRSRINCTAASALKGRYHWFSYDWMKPKPDGSWYLE